MLEHIIAPYIVTGNQWETKFYKLQKKQKKEKSERKQIETTPPKMKIALNKK